MSTFIHTSYMSTFIYTIRVFSESSMMFNFYSIFLQLSKR